LATDIDYKEPKNIYEKIIKDADLDNLWRDDFLKKWNNLKREVEEIKQIKIKDPEWVHWSLELLKDVGYYTKTQQKERGKKRIDNLKKLK
jgi:hypothetical protein